MLRVGYFLAGVKVGVGSGGVGPYATRVIEQMLEVGRNTIYHLFINSSQVKYVRDLQARYPQQAFTWSVVRQLEPLQKAQLPLNWLSVAKPLPVLTTLSKSLNFLEWQTRRQKVDLIHCPIQLLGLANWRTPTIITMHDVQELRFPEFFSPYERLARAGEYWCSLERATAVVVSFEHVKEDLQRYFRLPPKKIHVCPLPITPDWMPTATAASDIRVRYQLTSDFLLYPAQTWPHKNHLGLVRALAHLRDSTGLTPTMVCTGKQNEHFAAIQAEVASLGLQNQMRFLGIVSLEDLAGLYKACKAVVVPTLYEAGSFPVMEAILLNAAVICARVTSLPDTIGLREFTFDPNDPQAIAAAIRQLLTDEEYYRRNLANTTARREMFAQSVPSSVKAFEAVYQATLHQM